MMGTRAEFLKLQMRHNHSIGWWLRALSSMLAFEAFYQLCAVRGYRPRHVFLEASLGSLRDRLPGQRGLMIWPRLPLSIRVLNKICPYAYGAHAEFVPYTPEAEARASGRRAEVLEVVSGELRQGRSFK